MQTSIIDLVRDAASQRDQAALQRQLHELHSSLRNRGFSPVEALSTVAADLREAARGGEPGLPEFLSILFQRFISDDARATFGQYLTPMPVAEHLAELITDVSPQTVLDPFMGSGILLEAAARTTGAALLGVEINEAVAMIGRTAIEMSGRNLELEVADAFKQWLDGDLRSVDAVVMNPPFGGSLLRAHDSRLERTATARFVRTEKLPVELLALELGMDVLQEGGKLAAVLPTSVLTNGSWQRFRQYLFSTYSLVHVTYLPSSTFIPFRGVARACVIAIEKKAARANGVAVTIARSRSVGWDDTGRPSIPSDLPKILDRPLATATVSDSGDLQEQTDVDQIERYRLGDIAEVYRGRNPGRDQFVDKGPFLLKVGSLSGSFISWRNRSRSRVPQKWFDKYEHIHLRKGDICFTGTAHRASYIGLKVDLVSEVPSEGALASGEVVVVRLRHDAPISPIGLLYYLRSRKGYEAIQGLIRGSTAHVYPSDLVNLTIPDPESLFDLKELRAAHVEAEQAFREYLRIELEIRSKIDAVESEQVE